MEIDDGTTVKSVIAGLLRHDAARKRDNSTTDIKRIILKQPGLTKILEKFQLKK